MKKSLMVLFVVLAFCACTSKKFEDEKELWSYIQDPNNGFLYQKQVNGYDFSLAIKPTDLLISQELSEALKEIDKDEKVGDLREKYGKYLYLMLSISKQNQEVLNTAPSSRQEFGAMVHQLAFGMGKKVHLYTSKKDTISLSDYIYPRMYGVGGATNILFVYPKDKKYNQEKYLNFTIEDFGILTGEVKFKLELDKIKQEPTLNF